MHDILGDKFLSYREPAWHHLGKVVQTQMTASQAFEEIGPYGVRLEPLFTKDGIEISHRAIMRDPIPGVDEEHRQFGIVGPEYQLIDPWGAVKIWDSAVDRHIETIGVLANGATLFITTKIPSFEVKGDQMDNYLLFTSPMDGLAAARLSTSFVRTVCANTLALAHSSATVTYKVVHDEHVVHRLTEWLGGAMQIIEEKTEGLKEAFRSMADRRVTPDEVKQLLELAYPMPKLPKNNAPQHVMVQRAKDYEVQKVSVERKREATLEVFSGRGVGMDRESTAGTAFGVLQSVIEVSDYSRANKVQSRAADTLFGERAKAKELVYAACLDLIQ